MSDISVPASGAQAVEVRVEADPAAHETRGRRGLGFNIAALAGGQLVTWSMSLLWTLVIPRALGPRSMGLVVTAWAVTGVLGVILGLGTRNFLVREMVAHPEHAETLLGTSLVMRIALVVPFFAGSALYATLVHLGSDGTLILFLASGAMAFTLFAEPLQAGFQALERMQYIAYNNMFDRIVQSLFGVALVVVGVRAVGLSVWWLLVEATLFGLNVLWMRRYIRVVFRTTLARVSALFRDSLAYWTFGLFFMVYLWIDSAMLAALAPPEVVGWYGVPTKLFNTMMFLPTILSTAWLPRLVATYEREPKLLAAAARTPMELMLVLSLPICATAAVLAPSMIPFLYGGAYQQAVPVLVLLSLCVPPMYVNNVASQVLIASNRQMAWTKVMAAATIVNPALNFVLIRLTQHRLGNGAVGAAISLLITELLIAVVGMAMVGRGIVDRGSLARTARAILVSLGIVAVAFALRGAGILVLAPVVAATFVALAAALRILPPDTRREFGPIISRGSTALRSLVRRPKRAS